MYANVDEPYPSTPATLVTRCAVIMAKGPPVEWPWTYSAYSDSGNSRRQVSRSASSKATGQAAMRW